MARRATDFLRTGCRFRRRRSSWVVRGRFDASSPSKRRHRRLDQGRSDMGNFVLAYKGGGMAETPEAQEAAMQAWGEWFGTLGSAVVDMGAPFGASTAVQSDGSTGTRPAGPDRLLGAAGRQPRARGEARGRMPGAQQSAAPWRSTKQSRCSGSSTSNGERRRPARRGRPLRVTRPRPSPARAWCACRCGSSCRGPAEERPVQAEHRRRARARRTR